MKPYLLTAVFSVITLLTFSQVGDLVWEDNFDLGELDTTKWSYEKGTGINGDWGTGQLDRATNRPENVSFPDNVAGASDGCLVITTQKEFYIDRNYTSGRILSKGKSSWGPGHRIVARVYPRDVKHPGQGFAFWMMPDELPDGSTYIMWPQGGEIDIMEYVGAIPYHNLGSVHYAWSWENNQWQSWNHGHQGAYYSYEHHEVPNPSEPGHGGYPPPADDAPHAGSSGFHTYGIDWYTDRMEFFVDDQVYHIHYFEDGGAFQLDGQDQLRVSTINGKRQALSEYSHHFSEWHPFEHKMFAILSAGVGGGPHTYGGAIVPEAQFPCSVFIDWVRVYELGTQTSVDDDMEAAGFQIIPNPSADILLIKITNPADYTVKVSDMSGKLLIDTSLAQKVEIDISALSKGVYLVTVDNGKTALSKRVVLE